MTGSAIVTWQVYLLRCGDGSLYTGITIDLARRLREHAAGGAAGAKYLRGRGPFTLVYSRAVGTRAEALRVERCIKKLPKACKERLIAGGMALRDVIR